MICTPMNNKDWQILPLRAVPFSLVSESPPSEIMVGIKFDNNEKAKYVFYWRVLPNTNLARFKFAKSTHQSNYYSIYDKSMAVSYQNG